MPEGIIILDNYRMYSIVSKGWGGSPTKTYKEHHGIDYLQEYVAVFIYKVKMTDCNGNIRERENVI